MPGSKRHNPAARLLGLGLGLVIVCPATMAEDADDEPLPEAFLEFLADSEDEQGEMLDPLDYEGRQWQVLDQNTETTDE